MDPRLLLPIILSSFLITCTKAGFTPTYQVNEEFTKEVRSFFEEASNRGISLDTTNLILDFDENLSNVTCGECNSFHSDGTQRRVGINPNLQCWDNQFEKEALIFHELGHCLLGRVHENDTLPNGDPKSMMVSSNVSLYSPCKYVFGDVADCNNVHKRAYYIDELFDAHTPVPSWVTQ